LKIPRVLLALLVLPIACGPGSRDTDVDAAPDLVPIVDTADDTRPDPGDDDAPVAPCSSDDDCLALAGDDGCHVAHCLMGAGVCVFEELPEGQACAEDDPCVIDARCKNGTCQGLARGCDDSDPCTADSCRASAGGCVHEPADGKIPCDDGSACTADDTCTAGLCAGTPVFCAEDGNPCTSAACNPDSGQCEVGVLLGAPCDDGQACTSDDACDQGAECTGTPVTCDDGNACTADACDPANGTCVFTPDDELPCTDGNPCTNDDACVAGACVGVGFDCNDGNPCTTDVCSIGGTGGCQHVQLNSTACDDGNACTTNDHCVAGQCAPGTDLGDCCDTDLVLRSLGEGGCNDGDACTLEECVNHACTSAPVACVLDDPCGWARCVDGGCQGDVLPPGGNLEVLHTGFEAGEIAAGLTILGGSAQPGTVFEGSRALAVAAEGEVLRVKDLFLPAGTSAVQIWVRAPICSGTGILIAVDGVPHELGCVPVSRWSPVQLPIVADVDGLHTLELLWWGGAPVWLDELSVLVVGRAGCARGQAAEGLQAPSNLLAATTVVDAERRPALLVARADDGSGAAIQQGRPGPGGWSFEPVVTGVTLNGTLGNVAFEATARAAGGLAVVWNSGQSLSRLAVAPGDGGAALVATLVGSGPLRFWPDVTELADGRLFVGLTSNKQANGRFQPIGFVFDASAVAIGAAWKPSLPDAVNPNRVAVVRLDTDQRALVWMRDGQLRAAIAGADGKVAVPDFAAHAGVVASPGRVVAAPLTDGRFVVIWEQAGVGADLAGSLVDAYGTVLVDGFPVAFDPTGDERSPDVVGTTDGRFAIAWEDQPAGGSARLLARVFQDYGDGGVETVLDSNGPDLRWPRLALLVPYRVEVVWFAGTELRFRPWAFDCADGAVRCQGGVPQICVGATYARLGGSCVGPACVPGPCD